LKSAECWDGTFTTKKDARNLTDLQINITAFNGGPSFTPAIITGSPGQVIHVTVHQADDLSSHFQHNFSIKELHINKDIPEGAGHSISVTVTLPNSGSLAFFCKYHVMAENHGGEFLIAK
jgi:plastocyanin